MSRPDPKFSAGESVMVVTQANGIRASNTTVEAISWMLEGGYGEVPGDPLQTKTPAAVGWYYRVGCFDDGRWFFESCLRPRPEGGDSWDSIKQGWTKPTVGQVC